MSSTDPAPSKLVLQALAVTSELMGTTLSTVAARCLAEDLAHLPEAQILGALKRCRHECTGALTPQKIHDRLDDGRPSAEEAWARLPRGEDETVVWTDEMSAAWGVALPLMGLGDTYGASKAFAQTYTRLVREARETGTPANFVVSLGRDPHGRESVIKQAVERGQISAERAVVLVPDLRITSPEIRTLLDGVTDRLKLSGGES